MSTRLFRCDGFSYFLFCDGFNKWLIKRDQTYYLDFYHDFEKYFLRLTYDSSKRWVQGWTSRQLHRTGDKEGIRVPNSSIKGLDFKTGQEVTEVLFRLRRIL